MGIDQGLQKFCIALTSFSQQTCTLAPMTKLGLSMGLPSCFRLASHLFFMARPASMMASELPMLADPYEFVRLESGAWYKLAIMATHLRMELHEICARVT